MKLFIDKFSNLVKGTISGFDRIVLKSLVLPLMSTSVVMTFCRSRGLLNNCHEADLVFGLACLTKLTILTKLEIRPAFTEYFI